jgi:hypothetical protein
MKINGFLLAENMENFSKSLPNEKSSSARR